MGNFGKATEPCIYQQPVTTNTSDWHLFDSPLYPLYRFMYRQHVYDLEKRRGYCLIKWLIMLGFMDLRGPRVCRWSTPVLSIMLHEAHTDIQVTKFSVSLHEVLTDSITDNMAAKFSISLHEVLTDNMAAKFSVSLHEVLVDNLAAKF